jgi:hypothetical protein
MLGSGPTYAGKLGFAMSGLTTRLAFTITGTRSVQTLG